MENLDSDLLRTFAAIARAGSITDGAAQIHRSQSAASIQIKRLEAILGKPVFERHGRGIALSETGRRLLPIAHDVTARLDQTLHDLSRGAVKGKLRLAIPDDHGRAKLVKIIAAFNQQHPQVELDVTCAISTGFPDALKKGTLDLAIYEVSDPSDGEEPLFEDPTSWMASAHRNFEDADSLPVALFDQTCWWHAAALNSLAKRDRPYRIVYSSQSVSGVLAAVEAGIAVGLLGRSSHHRGLSVVGAAAGLGPTPTSKLVMAAGAGQKGEPLTALKTAIRSAFQQGAGTPPPGI